MNKTASTRVLNAMRKLAYVPLTPAAQDAIAQQPPMDPAMMSQGGMPPMDPSTMGGAPMPPQEGMPADPAMMQGGGMPPMQTIPGPNGEPIDPETGFIVVDPAQGIEMEPMTGILFVKPMGQFMTPDGQPIPQEEALAMIDQAMQQGGAMPPQGAPTDPAMMQGGGMPPMEPEQGGMPADPAMMDPAAQMASGAPMIDPQSGLPLDPATGMFAPMPPQGGAAAEGTEGGLGEAMPGFEAFMDTYEKTSDRQDKLNKRILHDLSGTRTDIQGVRREIQQLNDDQDTLLARLENVLNILERMLGGAPVRPGEPPTRGL